MINKFILLIMVCFSFVLKAQLSKEEHLKFIYENSEILRDSILKYQQIYFVRFDYCSSSEFCGKNNFVDLLEETEMPYTLFVIDTSFSKSELPLKMNNKKIVFVSREKVMRSGLFSGYTTLLETKKKKVKWLN